jgi:hypothetical protein
MENLPYVVFQKRQLADIESSVEEFSRVKKKARIQPKLFTQDNTAHHPCSDVAG